MSRAKCRAPALAATAIAAKPQKPHLPRSAARITRRTARPSRQRSRPAVVVASSDVHFAAREPSGTVTILTGDFDKLRRGDEVYYVEDVGNTGPMATKVCVNRE